jgi:hypothetical protein
MLVSRWVFAVDSLLSGPITSPLTELQMHACRFRLIGGPSDQCPWHLEFEFTTPFFGEVDVLICAVVVHRSGPGHCLSVPISGTLSAQRPLLRERLLETVRSVRRSGCVSARGK